MVERCASKVVRRSSIPLKRAEIQRISRDQSSQVFATLPNEGRRADPPRPNENASAGHPTTWDKHMSSSHVGSEPRSAEYWCWPLKTCDGCELSFHVRLQNHYQTPVSNSLRHLGLRSRHRDEHEAYTYACSRSSNRHEAVSYSRHHDP